MKKRTIYIGLFLIFIIGLISLIGTFAIDSSITEGNSSKADYLFNITLGDRTNRDILIPSYDSKIVDIKISNPNEFDMSYLLYLEDINSNISIVNIGDTDANGVLNSKSTNIIKVFIQNNSGSDITVSIKDIVGFKKETLDLPSNSTAINKGVYYKAIVKSNNKDYGKVKPNIKLSTNNGTVKYNIVPNDGYRYKSTTCEGTVVDNILTISNITSDISCEVVFEKNTVQVNLDMAGGVVETTYTQPQEYTYTMAYAGTYKIELWGAQGGGTNGGKGAYTAGSTNFDTNEVLKIYVGGSGNSSGAGGYNGGGNAGVLAVKNDGGGGSTDVRYDGTTINSRIMVAGGGGGANANGSNAKGVGKTGGAAGGLSGYAGTSVVDKMSGSGGTQISGGAKGKTARVPGTDGSFYNGGVGGTSSDTPTVSGGGGGGGGYYGGGSGEACLGNCGGSGGGGSSYISGHTGCVAITSASSATPKTGCTTGTSDNSCSIHYSGKLFTNTVMIDGSGHTWTNSKGSLQQMPSLSGSYASGTGNSGNGAARITLTGNASYTVTYKDKYGTLPTPTKNGYTFGGWYTGENGTGTKVDENTVLTNINNHTLYAKWTMNTYTISYNLNGGTASGNPTSGTYGSTVAINNPTRAGYTFTGWTVTGIGASLSGTNLTIGVGDINLTANWKSQSLIISYNCSNSTVGSDYMFTYTGNCTVYDDGNNNWRIKFLTSGTFKSSVNVAIDVFVVGGGGGGGNGMIRGSGGAGGGGGKSTKGEFNIVANTSYAITIGDGGASVTGASWKQLTGGTGGTSSAFGFSATGGTGGGGYSSPGTGSSTGGNGGISGGAGAKGGTGVIEFLDTTGTYYAGGGGGGGGYNCNGVDCGAAGSGGAGGTEGGGAGGKAGLSGGNNGTSGTANTGGGGGGGGSAYGDNSTSGSGGSGVVVIRNTKLNCGTGTRISGINFTYTGSCQIIDESSSNWKLKFLTSGTFKPTTSEKVDVFLVGGGGAGGNGMIRGSGGAGGGGGKSTKGEFNIVANTSYTITIGAGGASVTGASWEQLTGGTGGTSSAFGFSATGGTGGGGYSSPGTGNSSGGNGGINGNDGTAGGTGIREFFESTGAYYAGAGGGGGGYNCNGVDCGVAGSGGAGGTSGGGAGGNGGLSGGNNGTSGTANTGGGGGGGGSAYGSNSSSGAGGTGIVIIRNAR